MLEIQEGDHPFKTCAKCHAAWEALGDLVVDQDLVVTGYQPIFDDPATGLVLLVHERAGCRTTLAIQAGELRILYDGEVFTKVMAGLEGCPRLCLTSEALETCENPCAMAWVRQVIQLLRQHQLPPHLRDQTAPA